MSAQAAKFRKDFLPFQLPEELERLLDFENKHAQGDRYARGFELGEADKEYFKTLSDDPEFGDNLLPIGQATGTGSQYFFWTAGQRDPAKMPVVVFGDEGGQHVVADHIRDLLVLLAFDAEPLVDHDGVDYIRSDRYEPSKKHAAYVTWLKQTWGLAPVEDVAPLVARAQARHGAAFKAWFARFFPEE